MAAKAKKTQPVKPVVEIKAGESFITELDQYLFGQGTHYDIFKKLGAHLVVQDGVEGTHFAVWAPNAYAVNLVGSFNDWNEESHTMKRLDPLGIYVLFVPGVGAGVTCGEGFDLTELILPECQRNLLNEVAATGTPVILVLETGRPYCIGKEAELSKAVIEAWYPGEQGGNALCDIIFGDVSPSGRLPITFPKVTGQIPCFYNHKPSARGYYKAGGSPEHPGRDYVFETPHPLYPFGYGLSYTEFEYSDLNITTDEKAGTAHVEVTVKNIGKMASKHAVLMYLTDVCCRITPYVHRLRGFDKIYLEPGESKVVAFDLGYDDFYFINEKSEKEIEHGEYIVRFENQIKSFVL